MENAKIQILNLADHCEVSVLAIEYPGYGKYIGNGVAIVEKL